MNALYLIKVAEKSWQEASGGEGTRGGGLYVGETPNLGYRLYSHRKGWEKATKKEVRNGQRWEVVGTVSGLGAKEGGTKRGKSLESFIKKNKGQGFDRDSFQGNGEEHKRRRVESGNAINVPASSKVASHPHPESARPRAR